MSLTLKMRLVGATKTLPPGQPSLRYALSAVCGDENKPWSKFTPSGNLDFTVTNEQAGQLEAGDYLVTLTKV